MAAAGDLELGRSIASGIESGAFKISGSHTWGATRKWLGKTGRAMKGQHVHHGLIPNGGWGKAVPDFLKNQPWNLKFTETPLEHIRIHGRSRKFGLPQFNSLQRYLYGTPTWWKAANASAIGHAAEPVAQGFSKAGHFLAGHLKSQRTAAPRHQPSARGR